MFKKIARWWRRPENPAGHVYYAKLRTLQGTFYKLGFTIKKSLVERMSYANLGDDKLIELELFFTYRADAWDVEQALLEHFDRQRAFKRFSKDPTMPLYGRGQSELFSFDVLGLDDALYAVPDSRALEAMRLQQEDQSAGCLMFIIGVVLAPFTLGFSLLLLGAGVSGMFGSRKVHESGVRRFVRPMHPPAIQELVDALKAKGGGRLGRSC